VAARRGQGAIAPGRQREAAPKEGGFRQGGGEKYDINLPPGTSNPGAATDFDHLHTIKVYDLDGAVPTDVDQL
jgi:hypothetical protein